MILLARILNFVQIMHHCYCLISKFIDILKLQLAVTYSSCARRPAPLRTRYANRLNPENNRGVRSVPLPWRCTWQLTTRGSAASNWCFAVISCEVLSTATTSGLLRSRDEMATITAWLKSCSQRTNWTELNSSSRIPVWRLHWNARVEN